MHKMLIVTLSMLALTAGAASAQTGPAETRAAATAPLATAAPSVDSLMNRAVIGSDGQAIGKVTDVILGPDGQAQLIVIRSGGFLGIGGKDIAADLRLAEPNPGSDTIKLRDVTTASVRDMPEFRYDDHMTSLNRSPRTDP